MVLEGYLQYKGGTAELLASRCTRYPQYGRYRGATAKYKAVDALSYKAVDEGSNSNSIPVHCIRCRRAASWT